MIARRLGLSERTNFGKFFARHCGTSPGDFRRGMLPGAPTANKTEPSASVSAPRTRVASSAT